MPPRPTRRRATLVLTLGLALVASLGSLTPASAARADRSASADSPELSYVVNAADRPAAVERVRRAVTAADGTVVTVHRKIGVVVARSTNPDFATEMRALRDVDSAGATRTAPLVAAGTPQDGPPRYVESDRAALRAEDGTEPLEHLQWDLPLIRADQAHRISQGSDRVTVGVIDTGVDDRHPDLTANFSAEQSANCVGGVPDTSPGAWRPYTSEDYHGTHVAGTIAAARDGHGMAGVAPGVRVASIKVSEPDTSLFYTEAVVCAFVFAAERGVEVTNNSYYVDPWLHACPDDPDQLALQEAVRRAVAYASSRGTVHVAAAGNSAIDLAADELVDLTSPNDSKPTPRTIDPSECQSLPSRLPDVLSVSATGAQSLKSSYSTYGLGAIDVTAPGGDSYQKPAAPAESGGILSTMPDGEYAYLQGTSMASPHAAGVVALIRSEHPRATPQQVARLLRAQADPLDCPTEPYDPDGDGEPDAECAGPPEDNGFYGVGMVDALDAVRR